MQLSTAASEMRRVIQRAADKFEVELLLSEQLSSSSSSILVVSTAGSNLVRPGFESGKQEIRCFFELPRSYTVGLFKIFRTQRPVAFLSRRGSESGPKTEAGKRHRKV